MPTTAQLELQSIQRGLLDYPHRYVSDPQDDTPLAHPAAITANGDGTLVIKTDDPFVIAILCTAVQFATSVCVLCMQRPLTEESDGRMLNARVIGQIGLSEYVLRPC